MDLTYIMFTKHLEGLDVPGIIAALQSVGWLTFFAEA